jgi:hypothetical protein
LRRLRLDNGQNPTIIGTVLSGQWAYRIANGSGRVFRGWVSGNIGHDKTLAITFGAQFSF